MTDAAPDTVAVDELIDTYFELWRSTDEGRRSDLLTAVFEAGGRHVDPLMDAVGHDALAQMLAGVHATYPGFTIERTTGIDRHGDHLRFGWRLTAADGTPVVEGLDVVELSPDSRIASVVGFWGNLPAG